MVDTADFRARTEFIHKPFPIKNGAWVIGLDIGYSAVKAVCPNGAFCFPAFAKLLPAWQESMRRDEEYDIYFRDGSGRVWGVGETALSQIDPADSSVSDASLYGRERYDTDAFHIAGLVGIAMAYMANLCGDPAGRRIVIQTGLPPKYIKSDSAKLVQSLCGHHRFDIKAGRGGWIAYDLVIADDDVKVMPQPKGTLISASFCADGSQAEEARRFFNSNVIIPDTGFVTFDIFSITRGIVSGQETFPNLGMHEVFARTCRDIFEEYGVDITVPSLQNYLLKGTVPVLDIHDSSRTYKDFSGMLNRNADDVCMASVKVLKELNNYCNETDYIIPAGGAYDVWKGLFDGQFEKMEGLRITPGNVNDRSLSNAFSNARGYYYNLAMRGNA